MRAFLGSWMLLLLLSTCGAELTKDHTLLRLQKESSDLQSRLSSGEKELLSSKSKIEQLEAQNEDLQSRLSHSEKELVSSKSRIERLERQNGDAPKVAFHAAMGDKGKVGPYDKDVVLELSKVFTNVGKAYNPETGIFTAPVGGVYSLQYSVFSRQLNAHYGVKMSKNNKTIMFNYEHMSSGLGQLNNSIVIELTAGDQIFLVLPTGSALFDDTHNHNTFSGSLLFPL